MSLQLSQFNNSDLQHIALILDLYSKRKITNIGDCFKYLWEIDKNENSGLIYMVDDDYNVLVFNKSLGKLDLWITLPESGIEGFYDDLVKLDSDKHYLKYLN